MRIRGCVKTMCVVLKRSKILVLRRDQPVWSLYMYTNSSDFVPLVDVPLLVQPLRLQEREH